ncbi:SAGA complex subunit Sgf73, partial [Marasmius crinis-equi]
MPVGYIRMEGSNIPQRSSSPVSEPPFPSTLDVDGDGISDGNLENEELGSSEPEDEGFGLVLDGQEVDYDKQCGVINAQDFRCHSRPYDELLFDWHHKTKPRFMDPIKKDISSGSGSQSRTFTYDS